MRIISCIVHDHHLGLVVLAAIMCLVGSIVAATLFRRTLEERGLARAHWCFLSSVTAGAAIWATHFIAMLGYQSSAPVTLDGVWTVVSALIAAVGIGAGLFLATLPGRYLAMVCGGSAIGLAIAAMHYVGMFAYRPDGVVQWDTRYIVLSLVLGVAGGMATVWRLQSPRRRHREWQAGVLLSLAIIGLHFTGMAAFAVTPTAGFANTSVGQAVAAMAAAIGMVALLIVGAGISTFLIERKTSHDGQNRIAHIAMHDALTDLANRHQFSEALQTECERLTRYGRPFALLLIDLDRFKPINDTLGHPIGDIVLTRVAERLLCAVRSDDLVARIGGDEFAAICFGIGDGAHAEEVGERIVEILSRPLIVGGNVIELSGSVGVTVAPLHGDTPAELIQHADVALYAAKHNGRNTQRTFEPGLMDSIKRRRALEASLRRACMRDEFTIVYQPVFDSCSGELSGAEALLRWRCPERGDVPPSEFIPIAEDLGLISRIGANVLRQACLDAATWPAHLDVAVNVSSVQLLDRRLPQTVAQALAEANLAPERLELEITETALLNNDEHALRTLTQIRDMRVRISLDDFGTGYSSLSYLHRFPISRIKIDKSFVQRLPEDAGSASIVRAIAQLGESLQLQITAEGIETPGQLSFIRNQGCHHVQGFLTGRPVAHDSFVALTQSESAIAPA